MAEITSSPPIELEFETLSSSADFVLRRRQVEILPTEQSVYGSTTGNYRMTFNIGSSGTEWLDGINSYFRWEVEVTAATTTADRVLRAHFDEGGAHALIKDVYVQLRNGTRIETLENYNKLYAMLSNLTHSPTHVDSVENMQSGDSMTHRPCLDPFRNFIKPYATGAAQANEFTGVPASAAPGNTQADINTAIDTVMARFRENVLIEPARRKFARGGKRVLVFKLMSNFLNHFKFLPLPMLQGLQIVFELERPNIAFFCEKFATNGTGAAAILVNADDTINYAITAPRYVASLVEPDQSIVDKYVQAWKTTGISLSYQTYKRDLKSIPNGTTFTSEIPVQYHSVRHILAAIMDKKSFAADTGNEKGYPSNSVFLKAGLNNYIFKSGATRLPDHGPVDCSLAYAPEAFAQAMLAMNQHGNKLLDTRIRIWEWDPTISKFYTDTAQVSQTLTDATKFIVACDTTKHDDFTGLDVSNQPLQIEMNSTGFGADKSLLVQVCHDAILTLSQSSNLINT